MRLVCKTYVCLFITDICLNIQQIRNKVESENEIDDICVDRIGCKMGGKERRTDNNGTIPQNGVLSYFLGVIFEDVQHSIDTAWNECEEFVKEEIVSDLDRQR